jgi:WD40 repeat protein/tRNA A-37 threonylcarbamoyl transferase component Bud32/tetratricopeptide (TPR) repeat protein
VHHRCLFVPAGAALAPVRTGGDVVNDPAPPLDLPRDLEEALDGPCDRFEAAWQGGGRPSIRDHLSGLEGAARLALLRELVLLDAYYRRRGGEQVSPDDYTGPFPELELSWLAGALAAPGKDALPQVAGYEVLGLLGRGGMGVVYKARQLKASRLVALKMVRSAQLASQEELRRFRAEAEVTARLDHPNIVPVFEVGEQDGQPFFSMKLVEGDNLGHHLAAARAAAPKGRHADTARLLVAVARAVHCAHQHGLLHRDLKPANVLVDREGQPHVTDFGLARRLEGAPGLTQTGAVVGTPAYMAPEQALSGKALTTAVDVYGLGAILYECLTGRPPFRGDSPLETLQQVVGQAPVRPRSLAPGLDRDLETICLTCLHKEPARRYGSALALVEDLERWLRGEPISARPVRWPERVGKWARRQPALAGLAVLCLVIVVAAFAVISWQLGVVTDQKGIAEAKTKAAEEEADRAEKAGRQARDALAREEEAGRRRERALEAASRALALGNLGRAFDAYRVGRFAEAERLLDECPPRFRSWEWGHLQRLCRGGPFVLTGHTSTVHAVDFSPTGEWLATAGADGTVRVWSAATGEQAHLLRGHTGAVTRLAFSPDGALLASGGMDGTVRVHDTRASRLLRAHAAHPPNGVCLAFSPDGKWLASGGGDGKVRFWETATGRPGPVLGGEVTAGVVSVTFSPDGERVVAGHQAGGAQVWDARSGKPLLRLGRNTPALFAAACSPDGRYIALPGWGGLAYLLDARTGAIRTTLRGHEGGTSALAFSPDGQHLVSGGADRVVRAWAVPSGRELFQFRAPQRVLGVAHSPDGRRLAVAGESPQVVVHDGAGRPGARALPIPARWVKSLAFSPDGRRLATGDREGAVRLWDARSGRSELVLRGHRGLVKAVAFSPDGRRLASASMDGSARLWRTDTGRELRALWGHTGPVLDVAFSPDGRRLATAGGDGTISFWGPENGERGLVLNAHKGMVRTIAFSPDGRWLASGGVDRCARLWGLRGGAKLALPTGADGAVHTVAFSRDGRLAWAAGDQAVRVHDVESGREVLHSKGHPSNYSSLAFSPDGERLVAGSADGLLRILCSRTGQEVVALDAGDWQLRVAFSPAGDRLAVALGEGPVLVWQGEALPETRTVGTHARPVLALAFSPDSQSLATGSTSGAVQVWDVRSGRKTFEPKGPPRGVVYDLAFSPDGKQLTAWFGRQPRRWTLTTGQEENLPTQTKLPVGARAAFSPDGQWRAVARGTVVEVGPARLSAEARAEREELARPCPRWHAAAAQEAELKKAWFAAAFHWGRALRLSPDDEPALLGRGRAHAEQQRWPQAVADFELAVRIAADRAASWRSLALANLAAGNEVGYHDASAHLLRRFGGAEPVWAAVPCRAAAGDLWGALALVTLGARERATLERDRLTAIRTTLLRPASRPTSFALPAKAGPVGRAAILVRCGRYKEAAALLRSEKTAIGCLWLALAEVGRDNPGAARAALKRSSTWLGERRRVASPEGPVMRTNGEQLSWEERVEVEALRREVEALLAPRSKDK